MGSNVLASNQKNSISLFSRNSLIVSHWTVFHSMLRVSKNEETKKKQLTFLRLNEPSVFPRRSAIGAVIPF